MSGAKIIFVFPAFANDYSEFHHFQCPDFLSCFKSLVEDASSFIDDQLKDFHPLRNNFLEDELRNQYMSYIFGCTIAEMLREKKVIPDCIAGLSMGLYAALQTSGAFSFRDGLLLIRQAYLEIDKINSGLEFSMGNVIGLNQSDIVQLIKNIDRDTQISNQMAEFSFVISGRKTSVVTILEQAREEGALHTRLLNATAPYHSFFLKDTRKTFEPFVRNLGVRPSSVSLVSVIDQGTIRTSEQIIREIVRNLYQPFNWFNTQRKLQETAGSVLIECGVSRNLSKNSKFIPGQASFFSAVDYRD